MSGEERRTALLALFATYRAATSKGMAAIGGRFASDKSFYSRLADGVNAPTQRKYDLVVGRFDTDWPENTPWPSEVPRPSKPKRRTSDPTARK